MRKGIEITGKRPKHNDLPNIFYQEREAKKMNIKGQKARDAFDRENKHYDNIVMDLVRETIEAGKPFQKDEAKLNEVFEIGNKKWLEIVRRVNTTSKIIKLSGQQFRYQIFKLANTPNVEKIKSIKPDNVVTKELIQDEVQGDK